MGLKHDKEHDELLSGFHKRHRAAINARKMFDEKCDLIDRHVRPFAMENKWRDTGKPDEMLRAPHIWHIYRTMNANMAEPDPNWEIMPREPSDEQQVRLLRQALTYEMDRDGWAKKNKRLINIGNRYGLAVAHIMYEYDDEVEIEIVEQPHSNALMRMFGRTEKVRQENVRVIRDSATVRIVDRRDFWWQPGATDLEDAEWVHHQTFVPLDVLKRFEAEGLYHNVDKVAAGGGTGEESAPLAEKDEADRERRRVDTDGVSVITEYNKTTGRILVVANNVLIRHDEFPYQHGDFPFAAYVPIPEEGVFEGTSPLEPLIKLQLGIWQSEDDRQKAVALALNPTLLVARSLKDGGDFHIESGGRIFVDDPSQIQQINIQANSGLGLEEVQAMLGYVQQVSGVSPYISGSDASAFNVNNQTATGVNQLSMAAGRIIGDAIQELQGCVGRIGTQVLKLMHQFTTDEKMIRIVGENGAEWIPLSPEDLPFDFDCRVKGSTEALNKSMMRQQGIELLRELSNMHGMTSPDGRMFTAAPLINRVIEGFDINPDECWPAQDEQTQLTQEAETQQQVAGAEQAAAEAQMATPEMQMMMQQQAAQPSPNDLNGDGVDDLQRKVFESIGFKDLPGDAKAAYLERMGLPSEGLMAEEELDRQAQIAKIQQMTAQAASQNSGQDNA